MSARAFAAPEGSDALHERVHREAPSDRQNSEFPDWHPDLNGPHWQPTGGPNGTPFSVAIGRPGSPPKSDKENELLELYRREMETADQIIIPDDEDDDEEEAGPPHRDPVEGSTIRRKIGTTATGWEVWLDDKQRIYYYNRATTTTKYSWSKAEIEAEEQRIAQAANSSHNERSRNDNNPDVPLGMRTTKAEAQPWDPERT